MRVRAEKLAVVVVVHKPLPAQVREVGDGNINYVYILQGPGGALCVKQGHPYVRIVKTWALTQARFCQRDGGPLNSMTILSRVLHSRHQPKKQCSATSKLSRSVRESVPGLD